MADIDNTSDPNPAGDSTPFPLAPGTLINSIYRLVRRLGAGGMGEVWEARHERTKGRVAVKVLLPEMGRHEEVLRRFQREVEVTSALNHPNIVRVSDADKLPDGRPYLVMEFLEGHDLSTVSGRPLPLPEVIDIIEQAAMGLHVAHTQLVVHRDLKPANIFVVPLPGTSRSAVKILDFGISKAVDELSRLTHTRNMIGTPYYMAPEQATSGKTVLDARADQFSLAAIAYELITGRMAFEGDGMMNVLYKVVNDPPPTFAALGVTAPAGVEAAILRGLSKSPKDRFPTVMELATALKQPGAVTIVEPAPAASKSARSTPNTWILPNPNPPITTTLGASVGQVATAQEAARAQTPPQRPAPTATKRKPIAVIVSGAVVAAGIVTVLVARSGPSDRAAYGPPAVSAGAPQAPALPPAAPPIVAQPKVEPPKVEPPAPPKELEPAARPPKPEPEEIVLPQRPRRTTEATAAPAATPPASDSTQPPATHKTKASVRTGGPTPVGDTPTGIAKPSRAKSGVYPMNGDL